MIRIINARPLLTLTAFYFLFGFSEINEHATLESKIDKKEQRKIAHSII